MIFILLVLVLWCRFSVPAADWYATYLYPFISRVLSWLTAPLGFSVTELVIVLFIVGFIVRFIRIFSDDDHRKKRIWRVIRLLVSIYVWFYAAWGINYYRSDLYTRMGAAPMPYEEAEFHAFLNELTEQLNDNWCPALVQEGVDEKAFEQAMKDWYAQVPSEAGLCKPRSWQHPKKTVLNRLYSSVGVLGFIGPFFDEMHVNRDITPLERPFVHAHEYAHVLGVSGEAEANYWAFEATRSSDVMAVRYSGWYMLLHYSWNDIQSLLGEEQFAQWTATLRPEVLEDMERTQAYWAEKRSAALSSLQRMVYNAFLRGNRIEDGMKNYGQVLRMVLTFSDFHNHEDGR